MKVCRTCKETKGILFFYRHKEMSDGYLNHCIECVKKRVKDRYETSFEKIQAYERSRANLPHRIKLREEYSQTDAYKESSSKSHKKYIENNPEKRAAHIILGNAVRDKRILKKPCQVCGSEKVHAHHHDYSLPLDVIWLCPKHHTELHKGECK